MESVDGRSAARKHVLLKAIIITDEGMLTARIRDLSESGVKISCSGPPAEGRDVIFKHGEIFIAARVTWATEADAGLEFYRKLPPGDLVKMLQLISSPPQA